MHVIMRASVTERPIYTTHFGIYARSCMFEQNSNANPYMRDSKNTRHLLAFTLNPACLKGTVMRVPACTRGSVMAKWPLFSARCRSCLSVSTAADVNVLQIVTKAVCHSSAGSLARALA